MLLQDMIGIVLNSSELATSGPGNSCAEMNLRLRFNRLTLRFQPP